LKIDPVNTKGRRAKEVDITKVKDIRNTKHASKKSPPQPEAGSSNITNTTTATVTTTKSKKSRHVTTDEEKNILTPYLKNKNPSDEETEAVLDSLLSISSDYWTKKKVKAAWSYVQRKDTKLTD